MNEERELLEAAAKAAGMNVLPEGRWPADAKGWFYNPHGQGGMFSNERPAHWNPLTDDGDALRLAVKLRLSSMLGAYGDARPSVQVSAEDGGEYCTAFAMEALGEDADAATRRAIVRAAAAIGKDMP